MTLKNEGSTPPGGIYARKHSRITAPKRKNAKPTSALRPGSCVQANSSTQTFRCKSAGVVGNDNRHNSWTDNCSRRSAHDTVRIELLPPPTPVDRRVLNLSKPTPAFRPGGGAHFSRWRPTSAPRNLGESKELIRRTEETRPFSALPMRHDGNNSRLSVTEALSQPLRPSSGVPVISIPYHRNRSSDSVYLSMKCPRDYVVKINFSSDK